MGIQVALHHRTQYKYDREITLGPQIVRLRPAPHCRANILSYALTVKPENHILSWQQDPLSNRLARLIFPEKAKELVIEVDLVTELGDFNPFDFVLEPYAVDTPFEYAPALAKDLVPYLATQFAGPLLERFLDTVSPERRLTVDFLPELNRQVAAYIGYVVRMEPGVQTCEQTLEKRTGSCRDSAWLLVQVLRHLGFAARFVSGYLIQLATDDEPDDSKDSADLHAWAEVYLPGAGWIGLDPTSGMMAGEGHIPLACTPDASSAAPVTGTIEPAKVEFSFRDDGGARWVRRPALAQPFSEEQWARVRAGGPPGGRGLAGAGCPAHDGRGADVCGRRRAGQPAVERGRDGAAEAQRGRWR